MSKNNQNLYLPEEIGDNSQEDIALYEYIIDHAVLCAHEFGYARVEPSLFERENSMLKMFASDQKQKLTSFLYKKERLSLRSNYMLGLCRMHIEKNSKEEIVSSSRWFAHGDCFHSEKNKKFSEWNFTLSTVGSAVPAVDAEHILYSVRFLESIHIKSRVEINTIGCDECRKMVRKKITDYIKTVKGKLCEKGKSATETNPLHLFECARAECIENAEKAPPTVDFVCANCRTHFTRLLEYLDELGIFYALNTHLIPMVDYHTRTVVALYSQKKKTYHEADEIDEKETPLVYGGRFDSIARFLGAKETPLSAYSFFFARIKDELETSRVKTIKIKSPQVFLAQVGDIARRSAMRLCDELIKSGIRVVFDFSKDSLKLQLEQAHKSGAKFSLLIGQQEVLDKTVIMINLENGIQDTVDREKIIKIVKKKI
ncbi:MAG: ATP phosphoribosyltransferase regulatory subunit [Parcubacteria group bacterium]|nr:ATP phosphoribosyltransferase regulatory subunit [Parcubacteria group bacterium]